ncbi:MAG TPA: hypothetical protein VMF05_15185 [Stellaceae bacterium]|jgi:UDP-N-acetyl-D-glucosamine/UDP-N-acetyl-D-galactosamine dehydrogenase|nr:hypothetical protein [Stellaceae bacterium]
MAHVTQPLGAQPQHASVADPLADAEEARREYAIELVGFDRFTALDGLILAVPHRVLAQAGWGRMFASLAPGGVLIDIKSAIPRSEVPSHINYWSL